MTTNNISSASECYTCLYLFIVLRVKLFQESCLNIHFLDHKNGGGGYGEWASVLFLTLGERIISFTTKYNVTCRFSIYVLFQVQEVPFYS